MILPNTTASDVDKYAASPEIQIIENSTEAQAVRHTKLHLLAVNFWEDKIKTVDFINCDKRASVIILKDADVLNISVSDPTWKNQRTICLTIKVQASQVISKDNEVKVESLGSYVTLRINVNGSRGKAYRATIKILD